MNDSMMVGVCSICQSTEQGVDVDTKFICIACVQGNLPMEKIKMDKTKVILVGRHMSDLPEDIVVIEQKNIVWSTDKHACANQLASLCGYADSVNCTVLLQSVPGILAKVIYDDGYESGRNGYNAIPVGIIVSVPGERPDDEIVTVWSQFADSHSAESAIELMNAVNPNCKARMNSQGGIEYIKSQITPFIFSHIEWL